MTKRLYTVTVEFEYPVMAEDEYEAASFANEAFSNIDVSEHVHAVPIRYIKNSNGELRPLMPNGYVRGDLVYTDDEDMTLGEAIGLEDKIRAEAGATASTP